MADLGFTTVGSNFSVAILDLTAGHSNSTTVIFYPTKIYPDFTMVDLDFTTVSYL